MEMFELRTVQFMLVAGIGLSSVHAYLLGEKLNGRIPCTIIPYLALITSGEQFSVELL